MGQHTGPQVRALQRENGLRPTHTPSSEGEAFTTTSSLTKVVVVVLLVVMVVVVVVVMAGRREVS